jgi:DNA polymerase III epsilon subunit-like protein
MVVLHDGGIEGRLHLLVNEGDIIADAEALKVTGLTLDRLHSEGVSPYDAVAQIGQMLLRHDLYKRRVTLVGHNVGFDVSFLKRLFKLAGQEQAYKSYFSHRALCTQSLALALEYAGRIRWKSTGLDALTEHFHIQIGAGGSRKGRHDALDDAEATAKLLNRLVEYLRDPSKPMPLTQVEIPGIIDPGASSEPSEGS